MRGRDKGCSDPRDRVFAFRGLIADRYAIDVNYRLSVQSVYINSNIAIILAEQSLDVLAYCCHPRTRDVRPGLPSWCVDWSTAFTMCNRRQLLLWDSIDNPSCRFKGSKGLSGRCYFHPGPIEDGLFTYVSLQTDAVVLGTIQVIGEAGSKEGNVQGKSFEQLIESWSELSARHHPRLSRKLQEIEKTATVDDRGYQHVSNQRNNIDASNYGRLKLDVVEGNRRFVLTDSGCMGMAPPHVEVGDTVCILIGARVPFLLRKQGTFYTMVGELYLSDGYMDGRVADQLAAGEVQNTLVEIR